MITCATCGGAAPDRSGQCPACGSVITVPDATVPLETVAMAVGTSAPVRSGSSSTSRVGITSSTPDEGRFLPGALVAGRYRVIGLLGRGGMGEVYRATDLTLGQSVALKFLPEHAAANERLLERFHNEVRIARQVSHPNVCRVYDIGEADGVPFISMEYVDGEDLASLLQRIGRLPSDKALEIARKVCAGLAAAHERGIIHRDLKPHNIMLNRRGEVVVMDFGLAAIADELRGAEARNGTPAYMSPEQLRGDSVTARSDLYALGLIIYELFTGKRAFEAESLPELMRLQENGRPSSITSVALDADPVVEKVVLRCLQHDPAQRPSSALAVAASLPGGDPLAAALAAGETPSPELVARSGKTEGFALRYAVPCLVFVLLGVLAFPFLMQYTAVLAVSPMELAPEVLEQKAREHAAAFGYTARPADSHSWLTYNAPMISHFEKQPGQKDWGRIFAARHPIDLIYRQSPRLLISSPDGTIGLDRPALNMPGMVTVFVESRGHLRRFEAVAMRQDSTAPAATALDPSIAFRLAGLDIAQFREVTPNYVPPLAFDARRAWTGPFPGLEQVPVTVEIATYRGAVTSFFIEWPWTQHPSLREPSSSTKQIIFGALTFLWAGTALFCAIFFARRNLRKGRGDRAGALRLAGVCLLLSTVSWTVSMHFIPSLALIAQIFVNFAVSLLVAALIWLLYISLEPAVRARWPQSMITWNRLLAGQFADPRVGSHILIGAVVGVAVYYLFTWRIYWQVVGGGAPDGPNFSVLMGARSLTAGMASVLNEAIRTGSIIFFLLCGIRALVRRDWAAALVASVLLSMQEGGVQRSTNLWLDLPVYIAIFAVFAFILLRMGLVPAIAGILVINTLGRVPVGSSATDWYNPVGALLLAFIASIAIYGFWRSQSRPVESRASLLTKAA